MEPNLSPQQYLQGLEEAKEKEWLLNNLSQKRGRAGFWEVVDQIMKYLYSSPKFRSEMAALEYEVKQVKESTFNKYASSKDKSVRFLGKMPDRLVLAIKRVYGEDLPISNDEWRRGFFRRYPQFRVADVI
jgi:hypothetical protein